MRDEKQRVRRVRLGIAIAVQQSLLYTLADNVIQRWGTARADQVNPISE